MQNTDAENWTQLRERLLGAVARGDEPVLQRFYDDYFQRVYRYVLCRLNFNHPDTEEVVEEIFYQVFRDIASYDGQRAPDAWLLGIARHRVIDFCRRHGRRAVVELIFSQFDEDFSRQLFNIESQALPAAELERSELGVVVELVLSQMPDDYEKALRLRYLQDKAVADVAADLRTTPKAAEALLYRARNAFRDAFRLAAKNLTFEHGSAP